MLNVTSSLSVPTSVTSGTAVDVRHLGTKTVALYAAAMNATYQVQISCHPTTVIADIPALSWVDSGSTLTAAAADFSGAREVTARCNWIRIKCTGYTAGTPTAHVCGEQRTNQDG